MLVRARGPVLEKSPLSSVLFPNWEFGAPGPGKGQQPFPYSLCLWLVGPLCCSPLPHSKLFLPPPHGCPLNGLPSSVRSFCCQMIYRRRGNTGYTQGKHSGHFHLSICGECQLNMESASQAARRPVRGICILLPASPHGPPPEERCFLKVHRQGSIRSTDNAIK